MSIDYKEHLVCFIDLLGFKSAIDQSIKNNEICEIDNGNSLEIRENNETLNFWDIVIQLRINNKFYNKRKHYEKRNYNGSI